jgi:hypothetical protein
MSFAFLWLIFVGEGDCKAGAKTGDQSGPAPTLEGALSASKRGSHSKTEITVLAEKTIAVLRLLLFVV